MMNSAKNQTILTQMLSCLVALAACMFLCNLPANADGNREQMYFDINNNWGLWSPAAVGQAYLDKCPTGGFCIMSDTYKGGGVHYAQHGQTNAMEKIGTNPGVRWPENIPSFDIYGSEHLKARWQMMKKILGPGIESEPGAMPLTANYAASIAAASAMIESEVEQSPEMAQARAQEEQNQANQVSADTNASMERSNAGSAIDYVASYLYNFTTEGDNEWNTVRNQLFLPMALLILLPGAVLAQVKAIVSAGTPVVGMMDVASPIEGILRSVCAIFLIPATYLFLNYGIDLANSITYTIGSEYTRIFGTDMYHDAMCAHVRAFPVRNYSENKGFIPNQVAQMGVLGQPQGVGPGSGSTPFAQFEGQNLEVKLEDPCAGINIDPQDRANEMVPYLVNSQRNAYNTANAALAMSWNVMCAFQQAYLYYLWFAGPIVAALWVYPMGQLRSALPNWMQGVACICFWSLFWNTVVLLMACLRGVDETGTMMMSALNFLATASVKTAFDFASLAKEAGQAISSMAQNAASAAGAAGKSGAGGRQGSAGRGANGTDGGRTPAPPKGAGLSFLGTTLPGTNGTADPHFHGMGGTRGAEGTGASGTVAVLGATGAGPLGSVLPPGVSEPPLLGSVSTREGLNGLVTPSAFTLGAAVGGGSMAALAGLSGAGTDGMDGLDGELPGLTVDPSNGAMLGANGQLAAFAGVASFSSGEPVGPDHPHAVHLNAAQLHTLLHNQLGAAALASAVSTAGGAYFTDGGITNQFISAQKLANNDLPLNVQSYMSNWSGSTADIDITIASGAVGTDGSVLPVFTGTPATGAGTFVASAPPFVGGTVVDSTITAGAVANGGTLVAGGAVSAAAAAQQLTMARDTGTSTSASPVNATINNGVAGEYGAQFANQVFGSGNFFASGSGATTNQDYVLATNYSVSPVATSSPTFAQAAAVSTNPADYTTVASAAAASPISPDNRSKSDNQFADAMKGTFSDLAARSEQNLLKDQADAVRNQVRYQAPENFNNLAKLPADVSSATTVAYNGVSPVFAPALAPQPVMSNAFQLPGEVKAPAPSTAPNGEVTQLAAQTAGTIFGNFFGNSDAGDPGATITPVGNGYAAPQVGWAQASLDSAAGSSVVSASSVPASSTSPIAPVAPGVESASFTPAPSGNQFAPALVTAMNDLRIGAESMLTGRGVNAAVNQVRQAGDNLNTLARASHEGAPASVTGVASTGAGAQGFGAAPVIGGGIVSPSGSTAAAAAPAPMVVPASDGRQSPSFDGRIVPGSSSSLTAPINPGTQELAYQTASDIFGGPNFFRVPGENKVDSLPASETRTANGVMSTGFSMASALQGGPYTAVSSAPVVQQGSAVAGASGYTVGVEPTAAAGTTPMDNRFAPALVEAIEEMRVAGEKTFVSQGMQTAANQVHHTGDHLNGLAKHAPEGTASHVSGAAHPRSESAVAGMHVPGTHATAGSTSSVPNAAVSASHALAQPKETRTAAASVPSNFVRNQETDILANQTAVQIFGEKNFFNVPDANGTAGGANTQAGDGTAVVGWAQSASAARSDYSSVSCAGAVNSSASAAGVSGMGSLAASPVETPSIKSAGAPLRSEQQLACAASENVGGFGESLTGAMGALAREHEEAFLNQRTGAGRYDTFEQRAVDNSIDVTHQINHMYAASQHSTHINRSNLVAPWPAVKESALSHALGAAASNSLTVSPITVAAIPAPPSPARSASISNSREQALQGIQAGSKNAYRADRKAQPMQAANNSSPASRLGSALGRAMGGVTAPPAAQQAAQPASVPRTQKDPMGSVAIGTALRRLRAKRKVSAAERAAMEKLGNHAGD
jgi:hypothetical protein